MESQRNLDDLDAAESEQLLSVVERAEAGDESALPELRQFMADLPALVRDLGGNLAERVEQSLLDALVGEDLLQRESIHHELNLLRFELTGPAPTPVECLLVQRIATCWLFLQFAELRAVQVHSACHAQAEFLQRQVDRAQRRFFSAVRTLATVRRLALPVNLNLAVGVIGRGQLRAATDCLPSV